VVIDAVVIAVILIFSISLPMWLYPIIFYLQVDMCINANMYMHLCGGVVYSFYYIDFMCYFLQCNFCFSRMIYTLSNVFSRYTDKIAVIISVLTK